MKPASPTILVVDDTEAIRYTKVTDAAAGGLSRPRSRHRPGGDRSRS